jgi:hypothetical protein
MFNAIEIPKALQNDEVFIRLLFKKFKFIEEIEINFCINDEIIEALIKNCLILERLILRGEINGSKFIELIENYCERLKYQSFGFRNNLHKIEFINFLSENHFPKLEVGTLTTEEANRTRLVTKCRWIVEAINGQIKQCFRRFDKVWPNQSLPYMIKDFRIVCAILNVFHPRIESDVREGIDIAETMLARCDEVNQLGELVKTLNLNRRSALFKSIDGASLDDFPQLIEADLRLITLGSYQLKQAPSYYAEH